MKTKYGRYMYYGFPVVGKHFFSDKLRGDGGVE